MKYWYKIKYAPMRFFNYLFKKLFPRQDFHITHMNSHITHMNSHIVNLLAWKEKAHGIEKAIDLHNMDRKITSSHERLSDLESQLDNLRREIKQLEAKIVSFGVL